MEVSKLGRERPKLARHEMLKGEVGRRGALAPKWLTCCAWLMGHLPWLGILSHKPSPRVKWLTWLRCLGSPTLAVENTSLSCSCSIPPSSSPHISLCPCYLLCRGCAVSTPISVVCIQFFCCRVWPVSRVLRACLQDQAPLARLASPCLIWESCFGAPGTLAWARALICSLAERWQIGTRQLCECQPAET